MVLLNNIYKYLRGTTKGKPEDLNFRSIRIRINGEVQKMQA
jgi:hypothetical protein